MTGTEELQEFTTGVADAIRSKTGSTDPMNPQDFAAAIYSISGEGNQGILTVESVDELDVNASVGSLAVVAQQAGIGKIDLNNINTLVAEEDLDADTMELLNVEKFTLVNSINLLTPTDLTNLTQSTIVFLPKTFSGTNLKMFALGVMPEGVFFAYQDYTEQSGIESGEYVIGLITDNAYTIDQSVVSILENVLNIDEWIIGGSENSLDGGDASIPPEQIEVLNRFFEICGGVHAYANLYIKKDQWEDVTSALFNEVENIKYRISNTEDVTSTLFDDVENIKYRISNTEYKIINNPSTYTNITINPNTMYVWDTIDNLYIELSDPIPGIVNEYIIQFKSNSSGTTNITLPSTIKLSEELVIESNCIYQMSIVNNLATILKWEA